MKRWIALGIVLLILIGGGFGLAQAAVDPADYTGDWYGAEDGRLYQFHEGIITCPEASQETEDGFCGAYVFCKDHILLFTVDPDGQSQLRELYPAGDPRGEFLSETADGAGRIVFARSNIAAQNPS
ncbi:MAG: hypothetical protein Q4F81_09800 [Eubacteriales bacterium]|nr:hypothetical protein [Eubacteriales bacterium]